MPSADVARRVVLFSPWKYMYQLLPAACQSTCGEETWLTL
jgi:hypothetical protein